ncbi:MAG TPA: MDR family MFS transporter [Candidatus Dormibacteraeota bacterium]|nr:MDR family MFS transporter [Candidatus Dormibacteraeota bacterium]
MTSPGSAAETDAVAWTSRRVRVTLGLMLAMFVAAVDSSVVSTAIPTIAGQLGHFALYPWLIAGYLLTSTTTVPLWGRLADVHGRRRVLLAGMAWFLAASLLCASAPDMVWLVVFRTLQGIGAGCVLPVALTTVGDLFTLRQRARLQGLFSSVWAVAALAGPTLGAVFVSTVGWRWIFWINLPVVLLAAALLWTHRDAPPASARGRLDYAGALTLTAGIGLLLFGLDGGGGRTPSVPMVGLGALALVAFAVLQRRTAEPTIPFALLRHPVIGPATGAAFLAGTVMFAMNGFLPLYVQGVLGGTSFQAGAALAVSSLGWTGTALFSGRVMLRFGYERLVMTGAISMVTGCAMLLAHPPLDAVVWTCCAGFVIGMGMGQLQTPLLIVIQSVVDWSSRGVSTALNQLSRTIGGAVGVSLLGLLLASRAQAAAVAHHVDPARVADPLTRGGHLDAVTAPLVANALDAVFVVLLAIAILTLATGAAILAASRGRPLGSAPRSGATSRRGGTSAPAPDTGAGE